MRIIFIAVLTILSNALHAQMKLSGRIHGIDVEDTIGVNIPFDAWYYKANNIPVATGKHGAFSIDLEIKKPQTIFFIYRGEKVYLYAEPGKDLSITFKKGSLINTLTFGGSLKHENNFRKNIGLAFPPINNKNSHDSLGSPQQIFTAIKAYQLNSFEKLKQIKEPVSPAFNNMTRKDLQYYLAGALWGIIWEEGVFSTSYTKPLERKAWIEILKQAHQEQPLSDHEATDSYFYQLMVANYPHYLDVTASGKEAFEDLAQRIFEKPFEEVLQEVKTKGERFWEYKKLKYSFNGPALEFAMASFIVNGINYGELNFLAEAYADFKSNYPESRYRTYLDSLVAPYLASLTADLSENISFDSIDLANDSFDKILEKHKGKVVYIDLWGTWCGPCREEFSYNKDLKEYFKNKPVEFLYIAFENRKDPEKLWKETARFYNLEGRHILASKALRGLVTKMYGSDGTLVFPSYILVDRQGKITTLFAERPSAKQRLYKQIDQLLTN